MRHFIQKHFPWLMIIGPGLVVMLADTDAGSLITSAQMGATFGYKLLIQTLILIPILILAQELTVRLGVVTKKGHGELIKSIFGPSWAWLSVSTLLLTCLGAMITEMIGLIGVGSLFGISAHLIIMTTVGFLMLIAFTGSYRSVEKIALFLGLFELVFIYIAFKAHPQLHHVIHDIRTFPKNMHTYFYLTAANLGAVVMPWMIFYQQSAVVNKGLSTKQLRLARIDTSVGAIITQSIMAAILIAVAATIGLHHPNTPLNSVQEISHALTPFLGYSMGRTLFALGMVGACFVAAIVVTCTAAWGLGEVLGYRRSLSDSPKKAPAFYAVYTCILLLSALIVSTHWVNLIHLNLAVEVMNALLLPIVLGFLYLLACKALPKEYRLRGWYKVLCLLVLGGSALIGLVSGIIGA